MSFFDEQKIYWIGPRESDIEAVADLFAGSITIFGSNEGTNVAASAKYPKRIDHNNPEQSKESDNFMVQKAREYLQKDPSSKFIFYNANIYNSVLGFAELQKEYNCMLCLNDAELLLQMNNKHYFHEWFKDKYNVLKIIERGKNDCKYDELKRLLNAPDGCRFIVQAPVASGGSGTFVLSRDNEEAIVGVNSTRLEVGKQYLVSVYQENNVSVNLHAIIYKDDIIFSPGSVQIMKEDDLRLMYRGGDFIAYRQIDEAKRKKFEELALGACKTFQEKGYRGVCGIDAIITKDDVILLEVNDRFQASTNSLNKGLKDNGLPTIQEINAEAFVQDKPSEAAKKIKNAIIDYSDFSYIYTFNCVHPDHILRTAKTNKFVSGINLDGYIQGEDRYTDYAHLFRINFSTNIVWLNEEHTLNLHENIVDPTNDWSRKIMRFEDASPEYLINIDNRLALKVALLTQGVVIDEDAEAFLKTNGGCRPATNNAIDLKIKAAQLIVNTPIRIKFCEFSPFSLHASTKESGEDGLFLFYYDHKLFEVGYFKEDELQEKITKNGVPYKKVAYLSTDRLRVHVTNNCKYKRHGLGCSFCNMEEDKECQSITTEDIREVVSVYRALNRTVKHYLIGGQSADDETSSKQLVEAARAISEIDSNGRKYAMILPCDRGTIDDLISEGVSEFAFNIEINDQSLAEKYMPGKGTIPRSAYYTALNYAAAKQRNIGDTRSLLVVGLEPFDSLMECIEKLASNKIQPILSPFRPLPETALADAIPPSMQRLCRLYYDATAICKKYNAALSLGPNCIFCQNNTLSLFIGE